MNDIYTELEIIGIRQETIDASSFVLASKKKIHYSAGQFLTLIFPRKLSEERRSYSISSTPSLNEPLTITVKRVPNGEFSRFLQDNCRVGSSLYTIGASGFFTLPERPEDYSSMIFYAAGSGITPVLPLVKTVLHKFKHIKVHLTYSNRSPEQTIFLREIQSLERQYPQQFYVDWIFSTSKNLLRARVTKSLVESQINNKSLVDKRNSLVYLCGPHSYMQMISITLLREGIGREQIRKEIFNAEKPLVLELPPDTTRHTVYISYRGRDIEIPVQYPDTILAAAKKLGHVLPYSCEAGKCGTCAATCMQGEVWMSYNEVLHDKELQAGRILTCTGYPVKGDVRLSYQQP